MQIFRKIDDPKLQIQKTSEMMLYKMDLHLYRISPKMILYPKRLLISDLQFLYANAAEMERCSAGAGRENKNVVILYHRMHRASKCLTHTPHYLFYKR